MKTAIRKPLITTKVCLRKPTFDRTCIAATRSASRQFVRGYLAPRRLYQGTNLSNYYSVYSVFSQLSIRHTTAHDDRARPKPDAGLSLAVVPFESDRLTPPKVRYHLRVAVVVVVVAIVFRGLLFRSCRISPLTVVCIVIFAGPK